MSDEELHDLLRRLVASGCPNPVDPDLLDPLDPPPVVARGLGVSTQTLANWRCTRRADLPFVKIGRMVRYRRSKWQALAQGAV